VISYAFWPRQFGGEASAVGSKLTVNYQPVEVIGIAPASFTGLEVGRGFDVAVPICSQAALWIGGNWLDERHHVVAQRHGPTEARRHAGSSHRAPEAALARPFSIHFAGKLSAHQRSGLSELQADPPCRPRPAFRCSGATILILSCSC